MRVAAQRQGREFIAAREEFLHPHEQLFRRQDRPFAVVLQEAVPLARVGPELAQRHVDLAVQHHRGRGAEVVEQGRRLVEEERQVVLDAGGGEARADVLVQPHLGRIAFDLLAPARAEGAARRLVHRELAAGQQPHLGHRVERALRVGIEGADRIHLVAEQVDAIRHRRAHREQVDQAAAHRVFAGRNDLAHVGVAGKQQLCLQPRLVEPLALLEVEGVRGEEGGRREPHQRRRRRQQHHVDLALADAPQRGQPLGDQVLVRREGVVGQGFPVGKDGDGEARREERQLVLEPLRVRRIGGDDGNERCARRLARLGEAREQQRVGRTVRARQGEAPARRERGRQAHRGRRRGGRGHGEALHKSTSPRRGCAGAVRTRF